MSAAIECSGLTKRYLTGTVALDQLTLSIERGTAFGLVGANGAGKTTFVKLLMGFIFPTRGRLAVLGHGHVARAHPRIGYLHERQFTDLFFTGRQYLTYMAELSNQWGHVRHERIDLVLQRTGLEAVAGHRLRTYSTGMLQRLGIAQALLAQPDLVILDEPTSGLDPTSQRVVRDVMAQLRRAGVTIMLCSHNLPEVEALCDTVGILKQGHLLRAGPIDSMRLPPTLAEIVVDTPEPMRDLTARLGLQSDVVESGDHAVRIPLSRQASVLRSLLDADIPIRSLNAVSETLESVYLRETGWSGQQQS